MKRTNPGNSAKVTFFLDGEFFVTQVLKGT